MIAFLPGGGGAGVVFLLLLGWLFFQRPVLRITCGVLLAAWVIDIVVLAVSSQQWILLMYPGVVFMAWGLITGLTKGFGPDD